MSGTPHTGRSWQELNAGATSRLRDTRLQLHWAAQVVAWVGNTHLAARADDSHTNLGWDSHHLALSAHAVGEAPALKAALRLRDPALLLLDASGALDECRLEGRSLDELASWMEEALERQSRHVLRGQLERREYEMPGHGVADGDAFQPDAAAALELERWFSNADLALRSFAGPWTQASPVRCWPHHFDIATLVAFDPDEEPEKARSIGAGMTPGDADEPDPYWYVRPWPCPDPAALSALPAGRWNTEGWLGAVLPAAELWAAGDGEAQHQILVEFLGAATRSGLAALGLPVPD